MNDAGQSILINSIRKEDKRALLEIYRTYFPQVRHHVLLNSGNIFDAEDVFQDALVLIYLKIKNNTLNLSSTFGTYLNAVAKFIWHKELDRKRRYFGSFEGKYEIPDPGCDFLEDYIRMEKRKLILDHYFELNEDCRKILDLYIKETPISRITVLMGYSNDQYTKNRRSSCKERLIRAIWNNPRFKELKNEAYQQDTNVPRW